MRRVKSADIENAGQYLGESKIVSRFWILTALLLFIYFADAACTVYWHIRGMPEINLLWQPLLQWSLPLFCIARILYIVLPCDLLYILRHHHKVYLAFGAGIGYGAAALIQWAYGIYFYLQGRTM